MPFTLADIGVVMLTSGFLLAVLVQLTRLTLFKKRAESLTYWCTMTPILLGLVGVLIVITGLILDGPTVHYIGNWFGNEFYQYHLSITADWLAVTYACLTLLLLGLVAVFSRSYLHKDNGFHRFYFLLTLFGAGLLTASFAGTLELLIVGWELVGISSVLLISFFTYRPEPPKSALYTFIIYRCCDIGLIAAAFLVHLLGQHADFHHLNHTAWFGVNVSDMVLWIGGFLLLAAAGKAALFPFSSWLPRAMEGPTPSSAIFYGALSVHLGPLLLLRCADVFAASLWLQGALVVVGGLTALFGRLVARVQNDIKSRLAYASVIQLGVIVVEIGLGFYNLALFHVFTHAILRTLQILRAPSLLQEYQHLSQMIGHSYAATRSFDERVSLWQCIVYRFSLERALLDTFWRDHVLGSLGIMINRIDQLDQSIARLLTGEPVKGRKK